MKKNFKFFLNIPHQIYSNIMKLQSILKLFMKKNFQFFFV